MRQLWETAGPAQQGLFEKAGLAKTSTRAGPTLHAVRGNAAGGNSFGQARSCRAKTDTATTAQRSQPQLQGRSPKVQRLDRGKSSSPGEVVAGAHRQFSIRRWCKRQGLTSPKRRSPRPKTFSSQDRKLRQFRRRRKTRPAKATGAVRRGVARRKTAHACVVLQPGGGFPYLVWGVLATPKGCQLFSSNLGLLVSLRLGLV